MWAGHRVCELTRRLPQTLALAARTCGRKNAVRVSVAGASRGETLKAVGAGRLAGRQPDGEPPCTHRAPVMRARASGKAGFTERSPNTATLDIVVEMKVANRNTLRFGLLRGAWADLLRWIQGRKYDDSDCCGGLEAVGRHLAMDSSCF